MKLPYLDGVRSLAALFVFFSHAYVLQYTAYPRNLPTDIFLYPHLAVDVFIVLSGFCLGLAAHDRSNDSYWRFIQRRCLRILPAYYGAMGLSGLIFLACFSYGRGIQWQAIASSLLLLDDLYPRNGYYFSPVFWTIGIEFRLYFLFPLFLWFYRRAGALPTIGAAIVASGVWYLIAVNIAPSFAVRWHYLGLFFPVLFAVGLIASQWLESTHALAWGVSGFACLVTLLLPNLITPTGNANYLNALPAIDLAAGLFMASLLAWLGHRALSGQQHWALSSLSWQPLARSAKWSYSLYLLHFPLLKLGNLWLSMAGLYKWQVIALETLPVLACCWFFSQAFEQPFLRRKQAATVK